MSTQFTTTYEAVVGQILRQLREHRSLDQADLASAVGVTQPSWSRLEKGESALTVGQLARASAKLGVLPPLILQQAEQLRQTLRTRGIEVVIGGGAPPNPGAALLVGAALGALVAAMARK